MTGYVSPLLNQQYTPPPFALPNYGFNPSGWMAPQGVDPAVAAQPTSVAPATTPAVTPAASVYPTAPAPASSSLASLIGTDTTSLDKTGQLGFNVPTLGLGLAGIQTIGSLWNAWEANKLAQKQFEFSKDFANTNLRNSIQSYNTTLDNHTDARASYEGWSDKKARDYVRDNSLHK